MIKYTAIGDVTGTVYIEVFLIYAHMHTFPHSYIHKNVQYICVHVGICRGTCMYVHNLYVWLVHVCLFIVVRLFLPNLE